MTDRVLVVEDEGDVSLAIRTLLTRAGFEVQVAESGRHGVRDFHTHRPDAVILDVGLPDLDGWQVLERIRDVSTRPVLLLTAHGTDADKVRGLRSGADDYLTKPFSNTELLARVQALIRRSRSEPEPEVGGEVCDDGVLRVHFSDREVFLAGRPVVLSPLEFRLLCALVRNADKVLSGDQLLRLAWDDWTSINSDRVKFTVLRLRRKLGADVRIEAVRGFGYRYRRPRRVEGSGS